MWPQRCAIAPTLVVQTLPLAANNLLEKIAGPHKTMYSGRRKATPSFGDYRDLETKTKFSMICVKAQSDPWNKPFWVAKVTDILTYIEGVIDKVKITWFNTDTQESALDGKYYPEKLKSSQKILEDELCLSETTVYAYNFALLGTKTLPAAIKKLIDTALIESSK